MSPVSILGVGAVTPLGRDINTIAQALVKPPTFSKTLRVDDEPLNDPTISRYMRRADRFSRMATVAALDACSAAKLVCENVPPERVGMILSTGFGPHCRGFRFLDGLLENGDAAASPTDFSHSVHGAALAYISGLQGFQGPSLTVTDFENGFEQAIQLAQCWLAEGSCDRVLVGAVEEIGDVMLHCASRMLDDSSPIGEGAIFLMLGPPNVVGLATISTTVLLPEVDLLVEYDPMRTKSRFGRSTSGMAFEVLNGLLKTDKSVAIVQEQISTLLIEKTPAAGSL